MRFFHLLPRLRHGLPPLPGRGLHGLPGLQGLHRLRLRRGPPPTASIKTSPAAPANVPGPPPPPAMSITTSTVAPAKAPTPALMFNKIS